MKVVFFSSFISPHMKPFCDNLSRKCDFIYVQTNQLTEERRRMGYAYTEIIPYLVDLSADKVKQKKLADDADCVIINSGSTDAEIVFDRIRQNRITFFCNERLFKKGLIKYADPRLWKQWRINRLARGKNTYLLCLGSYVSRDFERVGFEKGKSFKFGYFPEVGSNLKYQETDELRLIWVGRMIDWKQPELMITVAEELEKKSIPFSIDMIGDGPLRDKVEIKRNILKHPGNVILHNLLSNEDVQQLMAQADALVITSNRQEGWGAVVNEALGAGTPVVSFETIGAANYLIHDGYNGQLCKENNISQMIDAIIEIKHNSSFYRMNALETTESWNAVVAAERFLKVYESCKSEGCAVFYDNGLLSKA